MCIVYNNLSMNNITHIVAKETDVYLSDIFSETGKLPYGIVNKGVTGCGATTLPIESNQNVIICVPLIALIRNKVAQYPNHRANLVLQGVHGSVSEEDIKAHLALDQPKKFICTYDSFIRLASVIGNISGYHIVVDEYTELLDTYNQRTRNIAPFVELIDSLPNVTYISATPVGTHLLPNFLKQKESYTIDWSKSVYNVNKELILQKTNNPRVTVRNLIRTFLQNRCKMEINGLVTDELFIFVNSVSFIVDIVSDMELSPHLFKVMCADREENRKVLREINTEPDLSFGANKKINFITSTAFLGCDFESDNGLKIVATDVRKRYSMLDISTQILQIDGRIRTRTNPLNNLIVHISNFKYQQMYDGDYISISTYYKESKRIAEDYHLQDNETKNYRLKIAEERDHYLKYDAETDSLTVDDIKYKSDLLRENVTNIDYVTPENLLQRYNEERFHYNAFVMRESASMKHYVKTKTRKECYELYNNWKDESDLDYTKMLTINEVRDKDPEIPEEVDTLGIELIRAKEYSKPQIRTEMLFASSEFKALVRKRIKHLLPPKDHYTATELKNLLNNIYKSEGMKKRAKATEIHLYVRATKKRVDSKNVYIIEWEG